MTYGLSLTGGYDRNPDFCNITDEAFRDVFFDGVKNQEITKTATEKWGKRSQMFGAVFDCTFKTTDFYCTHSASFSNRINPGYEIYSSEDWSPDIFKSTHSASHLSNRLTIASLSGLYNWSITPKWLLRATWDYMRWDERNTSSSRIGDRQDIYSTGREKSDDFKMNLVFHTQRKKWTLGLYLSPSFRISDVVYAGSSAQLQKQTRAHLNADIRWFMQFSPQLFMLLKPGIYSDIRKTPGLPTESHVEPRANLDIYWYASPTVSAMFSGSHYINSGGGVTTPALVKVSDFVWMEGNPEIKNKPHTNLYANVAWFPWTRTTFSINARYYHERNQDYETYFPAPEELGGVILKRLNAPSFSTASIGASVKQTLMGGRISLNAGADYKRTDTKVEGRPFLNAFSYNGSASFRTGNFNFNVSYRSPAKYLYAAGYGLIKEKQGNLSATVTYSCGNFFLSAKVNDMMCTHRIVRDYFASRTYTNNTERWNLGRSVTLTASYTFGYGKKIDPAIDIEQPGVSGESGILGIRR